MDAELRRVVDRLSAAAGRVTSPAPALAAAATPRGWVQHPIHPRIAAALGIPLTHPAVEAAGAGAGGEGGDTAPGTPDGGPAVARPDPTPPPGPGPLLTAAASGGDTVSDTHGRDAADAEWERRRAAGESGGGVPPEPPLPAPAPSPDPTPGAKGTGGEEPKAAAGGRWDELPRLVKSIESLLTKMVSSAARGESPTPPTEPTGAPAAGGTAGLLTPLIEWAKSTAAGRATTKMWGAARTAGSALADTKLGRGLGRAGRALTGNPVSRGLGRIGRGLADTKAGRATTAAVRGGRDFLFGGAGGGPGGGAAAAAGGGGEGGPAAVLGKLGGAAGAATGALFSMAKASVDLAYGQEAAMRKLAQVSPSQAMIYAELDINRLQRNQEKGEDTAGSSQELADSIDKFERAVQPIETAVSDLLNSVGSGILEIIADGVELGTELLRGIIDALNWAGRNAVDAINKVNPGNDFKWNDFKLGKDQPFNQPNWMLGDQLELMRKIHDANELIHEREMDRVREAHNRRFGDR